jgi:uncharacterized protein (DUF2252 family)
LFLAMSDVGVGWAAAVVHVATFMRTYATMIERFAKHGGAELFGYSDSNPPKEKALRQLIDDAAGASRTKAIGKATTWDDKKKARTLVRTDKLYDLKPADRAQAERLVADYVSRSPQHPGNGKHFFDIEDICGRTAGCGSLGRLRYAVLVSGEDSEAAKNQLLEFKESLPSAYDEYRQREQDALARRGRAEEVVGVERAMQTSSSPFIGFCIDGDMSFQVKPMGVRAQRLPWDTMKKDSDFDSVAQVYGELLAKCHAKADGQPGHPGRARIEIADALAGKEEVFVKRVTAFALAYCELVEDDHRRFAAATDKVKQALQL